MLRRKRLWLAGISLGCFALSSPAHAALSTPKDSRVVFQASGPAGMTIEGSTTELGLADQGDNLVITVPLANLTTGIGLRDRHMKEKYLEVEKYPSATLTVAHSALKLPSAADRIETDVPCTIHIHGQGRPVTVHYEIKKDGSTLSAHGKFHINMRDFGIAVPSYLGVTVKPDVDVSANFHVAES